MNLESLMAMLTRSHWAPDNAPDYESKVDDRFANLLTSSEEQRAEENAREESAKDYVDFALTALGQRIRHSSFATQPLWEILSDSDSADPDRYSPDIDAPAEDLAAQPSAELKRASAIIVLPGTLVNDESMASDVVPNVEIRGAITSTFVELSASSNAESAGNAEPSGLEYVPLVQTNSADSSRVLRDLFAVPGRHSHAVSDVGNDQQRSSASNAAASLEQIFGGLGFVARDLVFELTEQMRRSGSGDEIRQSLYFVPMRSFATGHLDQRLTTSVKPFIQVANRQATSGATESYRVTGIQNFAASRPAPAQNSRSGEATREASVPIVQPQIRSQSMNGVRFGHNFLEILQGVLPQRQNFFVIELADQKTLYVRDYFEPDGTLRQLQEMAGQSLFQLNNLNVVINGVDYGRLR